MLYLLLFIPPLIAGALGQMWVKRAFADGSKVHAASGMTGALGFASQAWFPLVMIGAFTSAGGTAASPLILIGAAIFAVTVVFQLVTLPVEFGASRRAMQMLGAQGILMPEELPVARKVLTAAALTYVIGTLIAVYQLAILLLQSRN
jgi:hypothetical protein